LTSDIWSTFAHERLQATASRMHVETTMARIPRIHSRDATAGGREQVGSYAHRGRDYYADEGRFRGSQRVSPGGEYLIDPAGRYESEGYTDQGYGQNRGQSDWRTEDTRYPLAERHRGRGPRGYTRPDDRIFEHVCELLTDAPQIDASNLEVKVKDGEVTLAGVVSSRAEKRLAEDLADSIRGVRDVQNRLRVAVGETAAERAASPRARH
jgi:osmotically-inducible protein OsmY